MSTPAPTNLVEVFHQKERGRKQRDIRQENPKISYFYGLFYVALTTLIMAYSSLFTVFPILIYLGMWLALLLTKGFRLLKPTADMVWAMLIPTLCLISTLWSSTLGLTLYLGTAFVAMQVCVIIMARAVPYQPFAEGGAVGIAITLLLSIINGRMLMDPMTGVYSLAGLFPSKNAIGFFGELGFVFCISLLFSRVSLLRKAVFIPIPMAISVYSIFASHSGTCLMTTAAIVILLIIVAILLRAPSSVRFAVFALGFILITTLITASLSMGAGELMLKLLGKDATLTGRTYLWSEGYKVGWEKPVLGSGYASFWVTSNPRARQYWEEFHVQPTTGFHFHNTYVQVFVDVGIIGVLIITYLIIANCVVGIRLASRYGMNAEMVLLLGLAFMNLLRSFVEVDFFVGPFGMGTIMFYYILPRLKQIEREAAETTAT